MASKHVVRSIEEIVRKGYWAERYGIKFIKTKWDSRSDSCTEYTSTIRGCPEQFREKGFVIDLNTYRISPLKSNTNIMDRLDRKHYVIANLVLDPRSSLIWVDSVNTDINFHEALQWSEFYMRVLGGFRLPTVEELEGIYGQYIGNRNICLPINTYGWRVWASHEPDEKSKFATVFNFNIGNSEKIPKDSMSHNRGFFVSDGDLDLLGGSKKKKKKSLFPRKQKIKIKPEILVEEESEPKVEKESKIVACPKKKRLNYMLQS